MAHMSCRTEALKNKQAQMRERIDYIQAILICIHATLQSINTQPLQAQAQAHVAA